jgi:diguanylate cyclase (GGDEF)-like protein
VAAVVAQTRQALVQPSAHGNMELATRAAKHSSRMAILAIVLLVAALVAGLFTAKTADDMRLARDAALLAEAVDALPGRRVSGPEHLKRVGEAVKLNGLRLGPADGRAILEGAFPLPAQPGEALFWARTVPVRELSTLVLPLVLACGIAIIGCLRLARSHDRSMKGLVEEIEGRALDMAMRDALTGLFNRAAFRRRLENAMGKRSGRELVGVVYIDLDRFKEVNDGFGHHAGDKLLIMVTERLRDIARDGCTISRLGGDEFAIIVEGYPSEQAIVALGESISARLSQPFDLGEVEASIGGSVGMSIAPTDAQETSELVRKADIAMYRVKETGRGMAIRFDESMEDDAKRRKSIEVELRKAIERQELKVAYQPFFASDGESVVGVEALVRWTHAEMGIISPSDFIPIAEEAGLIYDLSDLVMRKAMTDALQWPDIVLAMNLSPVQFRRKDTVERILEMVAEIGIEPKRIEMEITEGVLVEDADTAIRYLKQFRDAGMHIALDDFGTGYSSLSYLRRFPFDKLKVDQSFVRNLGGGPGSAAIIHAVVSLGRALGLIVHAEGIESLEQHIFLRASGCHHLQGFYFARPMPPEDIAVLLSRSSGYVRPYTRMWA